MSARLVLAAAMAVAIGIGSGVTPGAAAPPANPQQPEERGDRPLLDYVEPARPSDLLVTPQQPEAGVVAQADSRTFRYGISIVAVPMKGMRLKAPRSRMAKMIDRVGARMSDQTVGRVTYRFHDYVKAPTARSGDQPCDVLGMDRRYSRYANGLGRTPPGLTDVIVVYVTPPRYKCPFLGMAVIGGDAMYLNGVDLSDPQRLQDWITAHELGHNMGLIHSGSFHPAARGWTTADEVPANQPAQSIREYGDYLDVMGSPPKRGDVDLGADYAKWPIDAVNLLNLGVLRDSDLHVVRESGRYSLAPLLPQASETDPSILTVPIVADQSKTYWALEYRPLIHNAQSGLDYPQSWRELGYGVRLISVEHFSARVAAVNKVFHDASGAKSRAHLTVGVPYRLGGGATVTVRSAGANATVEVDLPTSQQQTVRWPSANAVARLRTVRYLDLPALTKQGRPVRWRVSSGPCEIDTWGRGQYKVVSLGKARKYGGCDLRAKAEQIDYAFYAAYDQTVRYTFTKTEVSREFLP